MLNDIIEQLQLLCDYKADRLAILNILQSKLNYIFSFKKPSFQSIENVGRSSQLAYYAFNFVPSGGTKNRLLMEIDNNLLSFFSDVLEKYNYDRLTKLEISHQQALMKITDKVALRRKTAEFEQEEKNFKNLKKEIFDATQAKVYIFADIINDEKQGSLMLINTEFANYYEDAIINKQQVKKEFLNMLFDLYDGTLNVTDTITTNRDIINNLPVSLIFMSDYGLLLNNEKLSESFKSYLSRGMARRSFIYYKKNNNFYSKDSVNNYVDFETKNKAVEILKSYSKKIETLYEQLPENKNYIFATDTNELIREYNKKRDKKIAEDFYKYSNRLDNNTEILKLNLEHSTWKIIKLAVLYHILENPLSTFVKPQSFNKAVEFFNQTHKCLQDILFETPTSDFQKLFMYLCRKKNNFINKATLREQKFIYKDYFSSWFDDAVENIKDMANRANLGLAIRTGGKTNRRYEICLYEPEKYQFIPKFDGNGQDGELVRIGNDLEVSEL